MNHEQVKGLNGYDTWQSPIDEDPLKHVQSLTDGSWRDLTRVTKRPEPGNQKGSRKAAFLFQSVGQSPWALRFPIPVPISFILLSYLRQIMMLSHNFLMQISLNQTLTHCWSINNAKVSVRNWYITALDDRQQAKLIIQVRTYQHHHHHHHLRRLPRTLTLWSGKGE